MRRKVFFGILAVWILAVCSSCATFNLDADRAYLWANDVYKYHYFLYVEQVASPAYTREEMQEFRENPEKIKNMQVNPDIPQEKWEVLKKKKRILKDMEEVLATVRATRGAGEKPPAEQIELLERLGNQLISLFE